MQGTVNRSVSEVSRRLKLHLGSDAGGLPVLDAIRDLSLVDDLASLLESWPESVGKAGIPDRAMAEVYFLIAKKSSVLIAKRSSALELCRTALDLCPVHAGALSLFEELADESWTDELCARYQVFLEDAPLHGVPAHTCAAVLDKLIRAQDEAALRDEPSDAGPHEGGWNDSLRTLPSPTSSEAPAPTLRQRDQERL